MPFQTEPGLMHFVSKKISRISARALPLSLAFVTLASGCELFEAALGTAGLDAGAAPTAAAPATRAGRDRADDDTLVGTAPRFETRKKTTPAARGPEVRMENGLYTWTDADGTVQIKSKPPEGARIVDTSAHGVVYEWKDGNGAIHITTSAPPSNAEVLAKYGAPTPTTKAAPPSAPASPSVATPDPALAPVVDVGRWRDRDAIGEPAPRLVGRDGRGGMAKPSAKNRLVVFSSKHCGPCRREAKALAEIQRERPDLDVVTVLGADDNVDDCAAWAKSAGLAPSSVIAGRPQTFPGGAVPHSVVVDETGRIRGMKTGFSSKAGILQLVDNTLKLAPR